MTDEQFFRHLYKQIDENKKYEGFTTIRVLERKNRDAKPKPHQNKKFNKT